MKISTNRNFVTGWAVVVASCTMMGLSFSAIPLYRLFCAATGYGGTPSIGLTADPGRKGPAVSVRFNADAHPGLPWKFSADQAEVRLELGEEQVAFYHARNISNHLTTGMALYNVTPEKVGKYFHKTACFCFNRQTLAAGESIEFPVSFWIDPAIYQDPNTSDVKVITLSYTFFNSIDEAIKSGDLERAGPHVGLLSAIEPR
jgi:cytochrome c oxidase assembly protein subunit 11